ncbi:MAG: hypothetical protein ORN51_07845 [Akkermansiaceae bacterium]|nr:hypothetical protein [Akkermansiaceae bacterium]
MIDSFGSEAIAIYTVSQLHRFRNYFSKLSSCRPSDQSMNDRPDHRLSQDAQGICYGSRMAAFGITLLFGAFLF